MFVADVVTKRKGFSSVQGFLEALLGEEIPSLKLATPPPPQKKFARSTRTVTTPPQNTVNPPPPKHKIIQETLQS